MAEIFSKIKKYAKSAGDTAKKYADVAKIKLNIKIEEANLDECLCELGRAYYLKEKHYADNGEEIAKKLDEADKISEKIREYNRQLAELEDKEVCEHCSTVKECDTPCDTCGEKIVVEKTDNPSDTDDDSTASDEE